MKRKPRIAKRKYSNDFCKTVANQVSNTTLREVSERLKMKYHDVQYVNQEYYRRLKNGEYGKVTIKPDTTGRVYLKPRVIGFKDIRTAWSVIDANFTDDQIDIIHKFYNTVLFETNSITANDLTTASYEQI